MSSVDYCLACLQCTFKRKEKKKGKERTVRLFTYRNLCFDIAKSSHFRCVISMVDAGKSCLCSGTSACFSSMKR